MRSASLLFLLAVAALVPACGASEPDVISSDDGEREPDPVTGEDELVAGVSCRARTDTAYDRGSPRPIEVITVGGKPMSKPTGHAFLKMQEAARRAGVRIGVSSGFRTMAEQRYLYDCYLTGRCNNGNLAAQPGYSNHQNGLALDLTTSPWLASNAGRFGFVRTVPSEPWHYEYRSGKDPGGPCSRGASSGLLAWESPKQDGWYKNGIWMKVRTTSKKVAYVEYWAGNYELGTSTHLEEGFPVRYTFNVLGERTVTAVAFDIERKKIGEESVDFRIEP